MKAIVMGVALAVTPAITSASGAIIVAGAPACVSEGALDRVQRANRAGDMQSVQAMLDRGECFTVTTRHKITILTPPHRTPGKIHFMLLGHEMWTLPGGVDR